MAKLIAVIIGIEIVLFRLVESRGVIQVNWDKSLLINQISFQIGSILIQIICTFQTCLVIHSQ